MTLPPHTADRDRATGESEAEDDEPSATPQFDTVFDAMAWAAAHPFPEQEALAAAEPLEMPPIRRRRAGADETETPSGRDAQAGP